MTLHYRSDGLNDMMNESYGSFKWRKVIDCRKYSIKLHQKCDETTDMRYQTSKRSIQPRTNTPQKTIADTKTLEIEIH